MRILVVAEAGDRKSLNAACELIRLGSGPPVSVTFVETKDEATRLIEPGDFDSIVAKIIGNDRQVGTLVSSTAEAKRIPCFLLRTPNCHTPNSADNKVKEGVYPCSEAVVSINDFYIVLGCHRINNGWRKRKRR